MKQLLEKQEALESQVYDLTRKLETEMKVLCRFCLTQSVCPHFKNLHLETLDFVPQNEKTLAKACEKARTEKKKLQEELSKSQAELTKLRNKLMEIESQLQSTKDE